MNEFQCLRPAVNHFGFFPPLPPPVVAEDTPADELSPPKTNIYLGLRGEGDSENSKLLSPDSLDRFSCSAAQAELASTSIRER